MLYYVNKEEISYVPSSYRPYHGASQANQAVLTAAGSHTWTAAVCGDADGLHSRVYTKCLCADINPLSVHLPV